MIDSSEFELIQLQTDQHAKFDKILESLDTRSSTKAVYHIWDFIRNSYPLLSANIAEIQLGLRLKFPLGNMKVLTVGLYNDTLGIDIREYKVCYCI